MRKLLFVLICLVALTVFVPLNADSSNRGVVVVPAHSVESHDELETIPLYDRMIAVVIGIDQYRDLSPEHQLSYAVKDAKAWPKFFESTIHLSKS